MKIPKSILIKNTVSLFANKYKYKIVLVCPAASWFRKNNLDFAIENLIKIKNGGQRPIWLKLKNHEDLEYCFKIHRTLSLMSEYDIRIESPFINLYTNSSTDIEKLAALDENRVKYISLPSKNVSSLDKDTVVVKNLDYSYKVFIGSTRQDYKEFVDWCNNNNKIRLTKTTKKSLLRSRSWGGSYFYVKDDKTLTMVRMFVGSAISKIQHVIKG